MGIGEDDYEDTEDLEQTLGLPDSRYSDMSFAGAPPPQQVEPPPVPRHRMCEACSRCPGCYHEEGGFDTDTDDDEIFAEDPEFDNQMTQVWAAIKKEPHVYNQVAGDLLSSYQLQRSRWRKFTGRLSRRKRLERRKKFGDSPNLRDPRKGAPQRRAFLCGECSSYIDIACNRFPPTKKHSSSGAKEKEKGR